MLIIILRNSESILTQNIVRQSLSSKAFISRNTNNNTLNISLTPAPVLIPVQKRRNNELEGGHNNSLTNLDNAADKHNLVHNV